MNLRRTKKLEVDDLIYLVNSYKFRKLENNNIEITYPQQPKRITITNTNILSKLWFSTSMKRTTVTLLPVVKKVFYKASNYNLILLQSVYNDGVSIDKLSKEDLAKEYDKIAHKLFQLTGEVF